MLKLPLSTIVTVLALIGHAHAEGPTKKIVLIAGTKSHGPGEHEYEKGVRLLKHCLDTSPNLRGFTTEIHLAGWPKDDKALDDAATILLFSDGSDRDEKAHPLLRGERLKKLKQLMDRGVGFVAIHYTVFVPGERGGEQFLDWLGGYFDYQSNKSDPRGWYSKIRTFTAKVTPASSKHPISRGLTPFDLKEEFYYNIRFRPGDSRLTPILSVPTPGEKEPQVVAWAVERSDGGRGFGFTGGHFHSNWQVENFRKMVLNALVWTAKGEVPAEGVRSELSEAIERKVLQSADAVRLLILTGHQHPAHDWKSTTRALQDVLALDPRIAVTVEHDTEFLARKELAGFDVLLLNYMNHERPGLSAAAKEGLLRFVGDGKGLVVLHFANGAFGDWPDYRKLARRVWVDKMSGHDPYGKFLVEVARRDHPISNGLKEYETTDELYFKQQGDQPIETLLTARSRVTGSQEPMAFVYEQGKGRVFQTVLGHDAAAIRNPGTAEVLRRACAWVGRKEIRPAAATARPPSTATRLTEGKFGSALNARAGHATAKMLEAYQKPPLTVECWARLDGAAGFNLLVANSVKESNTHWEIYTKAGTGTLAAYVPGMMPAIIDSKANIVDGKWHYVAMVYEAERLRLYVDAKVVTDVRLKLAGGVRRDGPLWIGAYPPQGLGCDGMVDEVRISKTARMIEKMPTGPWVADTDTLGLWHFDRLDKEQAEDNSSLKNPASLAATQTTQPSRPGPSSETELDYRPDDPRLKAVLIDRSPGESYVAVKTDSQGRLFVGGREALFVFEPDARGSYQPRRELFRFPADSWIAGIELRGNDLYVLTASALYLFPEGRIKRTGLTPKRLLWGLPLDLHVSFHCLAWGPEGDLYLNHGDPLLNYGDWSRPDHWGHWTLYSQPEGTKTPYTGQGAVLRIRPDGSGLRVVAGGLRGPFGLCFDRQWNLFTNDNDHESRPDLYTPARLLHVTPHIEFGWPRGWDAAKSPDRADLVETMLTAPGRGVPVGMTYYDDPYFPPEYRHCLLQARWDRLAIYRHPIEPRGASFTSRELPFLSGRQHARPIGVAVGRGGRVFATISYMAGNEASPRYMSDLVMITRADDSQEHPFEAYDVTTATEKKLWAELSQPSFERRQQAHTEILRRGAMLSEAVTRVRAARPDDAAFFHLLWLAGASGTEVAAKLLHEQAIHANADNRLQAVRVLGEFAKLKTPNEVFRWRLRDSDPRVRLAATVACYSRNEVSGITTAREQDSYLRQTATHLLANLMPRSPMLKAGPNSVIRFPEPPEGRLAMVLAVGRALTVPPVDSVPPDEVKLTFPAENAFFKTKIPFADGQADLQQLGRVGSFTMAEYWKSVPHSAEDERRFQFLLDKLGDPDDAVRLQAAYFLSLLRDARAEPLIAKTRQTVRENKLAGAPVRSVDRAWIAGPFDDSAAGAHAPELGAVDLTASYQSGVRKIAWRELTGQNGQLDLREAAFRTHSCYLFFRLQTATRQLLSLRVEGPAGTALWHNGRPLWQLGGAATALVDLEPGTNDFLLRAQGDSSRLSIAYRTKGEVTATLPDKLDTATLAQRLKEAAGGKEPVITEEFLKIDWPREVKQGNRDEGRKLFGSLGCVKCHAITADQKGGGAPSLFEANKRFTVSHLVESILLPNRQVADVFRSTSIETKKGLVFSGLVINETADRLELLLPDATQQAIAKAEIETRTLTDKSPMPAGLVKTPRELGDLLAYLLSDRPLPP